MEIIRNVIASVSGICGEQRTQPGKIYRPSRHCISVKCGEGTLLYHTLTGAVLLFPEAETETAQQEIMIRNWLLVPEDFDERRHADEVRRIGKMLHPLKQEKTDFTILTTTDCNARCFYCYELGIRRFAMAPETARETAEYIAKACGGKDVQLRWFGGEPLYNREAIGIICSGLREKGIAYESSMVSNGFYLDQETVRKACDDWHLKKVQITIDGTEAIYNRTKAYIDPEDNPYLRVMNNIKAAMEAGIHVTIRMNMDARNAENLLQLTDEIAGRFSGQNGLDIYVALLQEFSGKTHPYETCEQTVQAFFAIRDKADSYGLQRENELPQALYVNRCMADNEASEVILPDGRVGRCEHFSEEMITGDIWDNQRDTETEKVWKEALDVPECAECVLYPQCRKLAKCEWNRNGCLPEDRIIKIQELKRKILMAYREYRSKGEKA